MDHPDDYQYIRIAVEENPGIFGSLGSLKDELTRFRNDWREKGVIIEAGSGEQRKRVLLSRSRYIDFWRQRTKARAA